MFLCFILWCTYFKCVSGSLTLTCKTGVQGQQHLTGKTGARLNIFTALSMQCDGLVTAWEFYALTDGDIYLGLWKYDDVAKSAVLTNKNKITVSSGQVAKSSVYTVPKADQMLSKIGLIIGHHFDTDNSSYIMSMAKDTELCCGLAASDLGPFIGKALYDSDIPVGKIVSGLTGKSTDTIRIAGAAAHVMSEPTVSFQPAGNTDLAPVLDDSDDTCLELPTRIEWYFLTIHYSTLSFRSVEFNVTIQSNMCHSISMFMSANEEKTYWKMCERGISQTNGSNIMCPYVCSCEGNHVQNSCNSFKLYCDTNISVCDIQPSNYSFK